MLDRLKCMLDKHIDNKSNNNPVNKDLYQYPPKLSNTMPRILSVSKTSNINADYKSLAPIKEIPSTGLSYSDIVELAEDVYPDIIIKRSIVEVSKNNHVHLYRDNGKYIVRFKLEFYFRTIISNLELSFQNICNVKEANLYIHATNEDTLYHAIVIYREIGAPNSYRPYYGYIINCISLDANKVNKLDILLDINYCDMTVELVFDEPNIDIITCIMKYDELYIGTKKRKTISKLINKSFVSDPYREIKEYNYPLEQLIILYELFLYRYTDRFLNDIDNEFLFTLAIRRFKLDIGYLNFKNDEQKQLLEPNTFKAMIYEIVNLPKDELKNRIKILKSKLVIINQPKNFNIMSIVDSKEFLQKCHIVDFDSGEIKKQITNYDEVKTPASISEKRWADLVNQAKTPHIRDFTALCSTVSTLSKLDLLLKLMKKCRYVENAFADLFLLQLHDDEVGFITNRMSMKFVNFYNLTQIKDDLFKHKANCTIPIDKFNDLFTEVCITDVKVVIDLNVVDITKAENIKITMQNPAYDSSELLEFKQVSNLKFELHLPDIMTILFETSRNIMIDIEFTSNIVVKPMLIYVYYNSISLNTKAYDTFRAMMGRIDLKKKENLLKFITRDNGGIRSEIPIIINGNSNLDDNDTHYERLRWRELDDMEEFV